MRLHQIKKFIIAKIQSYTIKYKKNLFYLLPFLHSITNSPLRLLIYVRGSLISFPIAPIINNHLSIKIKSINTENAYKNGKSFHPNATEALIDPSHT